LNEYGIEPIVVDPQANREDTKQEYGIELMDIDDVKDADCLVFAVAMMNLKYGLGADRKFFKNIDNSEKVIIDVKGILIKIKSRN